jgi:hypothetical protein
MSTPRNGSVWTLQPAGLDAWDAADPSRRQAGPGRMHAQLVADNTGQDVRVIQPRGCPRNGTMGHCYVENARTGQFIGLVLISSLVR